MQKYDKKSIKLAYPKIYSTNIYRQIKINSPKKYIGIPTVKANLIIINNISHKKNCQQQFNLVKR